MSELPELLNPKNLVENIWLFSILCLFLIFYSPRLHPKLPLGIKNLFNNPLFRGTVIFMIIYTAHRSFTYSLIATIIFIVTLNMIQTNQVLEIIKSENFESEYGPPVAKCNVYKDSDEYKLGTKFYPLNDDNEGPEIINLDRN